MLLQEGSLSPTEIKVRVSTKYHFTPATITFYTVLYRLRREGLVKKVEESFRSEYEITSKGRVELGKGRALLKYVLGNLG